MEIGAKVVQLREKLGMNQQALARTTGVPQATISRIERGIIQQPRAELLRRLAEVLNVTVDYLTGRTAEMSASDVVSTDPRAQAIFRDYQELSEEQKRELATFVRFQLEKRERERKERGDRG